MNTKTFDEWSKSLETMDFDHYSLEMKNTILKGNLPDNEKKLFEICFDYVYKLHKENKPLDVKLLQIHLEQIHVEHAKSNQHQSKMEIHSTPMHLLVKTE